MSVSKTRELADDKSGSPSAKRSSGAGASYIPSKGERVEQKRSGIARSGTVWYADQLQVLVKWDSAEIRRVEQPEAQQRKTRRYRP